MVKAVSWRIIATLVTFAVAYLITKKPLLAVSIGFADSMIKFGAYYFHERLWLKSNFGRKKVKEDYMI